MEDIMLKVPAGTVNMRDDRIGEEWAVKIQPFLLSKFPVTQELYYSVTQQNPSTFKGNQLPVETVSWKDATLFCNRLSEHVGYTPCYVWGGEKEAMSFVDHADGFRLPTEAEWQFACQAGTGAKRYGEVDKIAWYKANSQQATHEVGLKAPNAWGFYDMLGNVWEWCHDIYDESVYGSYRIFRGGGWADVERSVMANTRRRSHPIAFKIDDLGFRIARNWKEE